MKLNELGFLYNYSFQNLAIFMLIIIIALFITNKLLFLFHDSVHGIRSFVYRKLRKLLLYKKQITVTVLHCIIAPAFLIVRGVASRFSHCGLAGKGGNCQKNCNRICCSQSKKYILLRIIRRDINTTPKR